MSKITNSLVTRFMACALLATAAGCDKSPAPEQKPQAVPQVGPSIVAGTNIVLPVTAPTGKRFLSGWQLVKLYDTSTFCQKYTSAGCEATEDMEVKTTDRISINHNRLKKADPSDKNTFQTFFAVNRGVLSSNPSLMLHFNLTLSLEVSGVCQTAEQMTSDMNGLSVEVYANGDNLDANRYNIMGEKLDRVIEAGRKLQRSTLGHIFCSHYVLNQSEGTLTKYSSVDGVIQSEPPVEITLLEKTPNSKMFLAPK